MVLPRSVSHSRPFPTLPPRRCLPRASTRICAAGDTSYALDVADASLVSGADVRLWSSNHSQAQKWYIEPDSEGYYTITSMGSARARRFQWRTYPWHERVAVHAVWQQHAEVAPRRQRQRLLLAYLEGQRARARHRRRNLRRWYGRAHVDSERGHRPIVRLQPVRAHVRRRHLRACAFERQGHRPRRVRRIDRIGC